MKGYFRILLISFLILPSGFAQTIISSHISNVVLFSDQALVTRKAQTRVSKGLQELLLELEAFNIDKDSISAKVFGEGELFSVQYKKIFLKEPPQENIQRLEEKLKRLEISRRSLMDTRKVLEKKETLLTSIINFAGAQLPKDMKTQFPDISDFDHTLSFIEEQFNSIYSKDKDLDLKIQEIDKEINVVKKELSTLKRPQGKYKAVIEILFNSRKEQAVSVEATYLVTSAFWRPRYKVDVPLDLKDIKLVMFSQISQKTGEDWRNIHLSVSNVIPLRGVRLPSLQPWFLDIQPPRRRLFRLERKGSIGFEKPAEVSSLDKLMNPPQEPREAQFVAAERKKLPLSFEYKLPQRLSIESKDKETLLPLFTRTLKGKFYHYAVPKVSSLTFLVCEASSDKELISGPLNVYFGGHFIGKTYLEEKKPQEPFYFNLGADREVRIKREKIKDKVKETFFGKIERKTVIREMAFKISIENLKDKSIKIKILDTIPVSRTDKIVVKDLTITPSPTVKNYEGKEGLLLWELKLKPGETKTININFTLTYPRDVDIGI